MFDELLAKLGPRCIIQDTWYRKAIGRGLKTTFRSQDDIYTCHACAMSTFQTYGKHINASKMHREQYKCTYSTLMIALEMHGRSESIIVKSSSYCRLLVLVSCSGFHNFSARTVLIPKSNSTQQS